MTILAMNVREQTVVIDMGIGMYNRKAVNPKATKLSLQRCKQHLRWMVNVRKLVKINKSGEYYL